MEVWKPISGFVDYEVSNYGNVRNVNWRSPGRIRNLTPCCDKDGYMMVCLSPNGHQQNYRVHRLVLQTFNPIEGCEDLHVNHKDENKANNHVDNLEWVTPKENNNYGGHNNRMSGTKRNTRCIPVKQLSLAGDLIKVWKSAHEVMRELGYNHAFIARCCRDNKKTAYGFRWEYAERSG